MNTGSPNLHQLLIDATSDILEVSIDSKQSLIEQGLDSLAAEELIATMRRAGFELDYKRLMDGACVDSLASTLRTNVKEGPTVAPNELLTKPIPLTGPQEIWAQLEQRGWGSWANISLCVSFSASSLPAAFLPALAQSLCDANDALRMILVRSESPGGKPMQQTVSEFQIPVSMHEAPGFETEALRLIEAFEGEYVSPYLPSTRALVLRAAGSGGRHWLCITVHHIFADRHALNILRRQLLAMIETGQFQVSPKPSIGYADYALWQDRSSSGAEIKQAESKLRQLLKGADVSFNRAVPRLGSEALQDLNGIPPVSTFSEAESAALEALATRLGTTLPLLLHAVTSVLAARLTGDEQAISGETDVLLCHVVSNREGHEALREIVGCLDTSVPVAVNLKDCDTLKTLSTRTREAFAEAHECIGNLPRGGWFGEAGADTPGDHNGLLFERVGHINIIHRPSDQTDGRRALDIKVHPVRRTQQTRWGLLFRLTLPSSTKAFSTVEKEPQAVEPSGISLSVFAEDRPLAAAAHYCFTELMRALLRAPTETAGDARILELLNQTINHAAFAASQVRRTTALVPPSNQRDAFIWNKLVERQQRWYKHNEHFKLCRDEHNRFIGTPKNPFPFTQLDKLAERTFLEELDLALPDLLHVIPRENLQESLIRIAPSLPDSFVIKPVGAGHSFGVTVVRNGLDLTRGGVPFDATIVATELSQMADRGYCVHEGKEFPFNFSSFLVEEFVIDELGFVSPTDYKIFVIGEKLLWAQLIFNKAGHVWVAFVDADFKLLPQPAWDPTTCWRTHRTLVCTEKEWVAERKPGCWELMVKESVRFGSRMNLFARLDWYADITRGPLLGELTTFPHMLQPRSFYSTWANNTVRAAWRNPDGAAPLARMAPAGKAAIGANLAKIPLCRPESPRETFLDFFPTPSENPWAAGIGLTYRNLHDFVAAFDLAPWGIEGGDCVAMLIGNGVQLGALLLATMNRYLALPTDVALPTEAIATELREWSARALVVIAGTDEARKARAVAQKLSNLVLIELTPAGNEAFAALPVLAEQESPLAKTTALGPDDRVLLLRTSGTTGNPKMVSYTLARLILSGSGIARSIKLSPDDIGISMLPLRHVGGITCNLIAPLLSGASMVFCKGLDPKTFFAALSGPQGASWCYLVPAHWSMLVQYADAHPELERTRPWPRLRIVRNAGSSLSHEFALKLSRFFGESVTILPTYGMTEAMPIASPPLGYKLERPGSVGPALPSVSIEIVDLSESGNCDPVPDGTIGEITVAGPTVMPYYENDTTATADIFTARGYFRTGDIGRLDPDGSGWLYITDRLKNVINRGGETIAPAEVEAVLRAYPAFKRAGTDLEIMVFGRKHEQLQEEVALAIAPSSALVEFSEIRDWAARQLPESMIPRTLLLIPELPGSESDKRVRAEFANRLRSLLPPGELDNLQVYKLGRIGESPQLLNESDRSPAFGVSASDYDAPDKKISSVLAVVRDFLENPVAIDADTRLVDVGVNSLAAVELSERLGRQFGVRLDPWVISDFPTPRDLASQLSPSTPSTRVQTLVAAQGPGPDETRPARLRILMLHGEGADADLMDKGMRSTGWSQGLKEAAEFVYINAPNFCAPKPEFHPIAVAAGLYDKPQYFSWGVPCPGSLEKTITTVMAALDENAPIHGIGGICDGGLVAALVASRRPELLLYLNFASSPIDRFSTEQRNLPWSIPCPSLHLISPNDPFLSLEELLQIPKRCENALVLQHGGGHTVPLLADPASRQEVLSALKAVHVKQDPGAFKPTKCVARTYSAENGIDRSASSDWMNVPKLSEFHKPARSFIGESATAINSVQKSPKGETPCTNELVSKILDVWKDVLQRKEIGLDEDFFKLGGNSLLATILITRLQKALNQPIQIDSLFNSPTIRSLAQMLRGEDQQKTDESCIVPIRTSGYSHNLPLVLVHGLGGSTYQYRLLAEHLEDNQSVFAIRSPDHPFTSLSTMCETYLDALLKEFPDGKFILGGYCFGSGIAFEMIRLLKKQGFKTYPLLVIDFVYKNQVRYRPSYLIKLLKEESPRRFWQRIKHRASKLEKRFTRFRNNPEKGLGPQVEDYMDLPDLPPGDHKRIATYFFLLKKHKPQSYDGDVALIFSESDYTRRDKFAGWDRFVNGNITVETVDVQHTSMMEYPGIGKVAKAVSRILKRINREELIP